MSTPTAEQNAQLVTDHFTQVFIEETYDDAAVSDDYVMYWGRKDNEYSFEDQKAQADETEDWFAETKTEIDDVVATEEKVVIRYHWTGTHVGTWEGISSIPATEATVRVNGIGIFTVADGLIEEVWYMQDEWGLEKQLDEASE